MKHKVFLLLFITTSSLWPQSPNKEKDNKKAVSLGYISDRMLELEPCGCAFNPQGGIVREYNLISKWRKSIKNPFLYFSGGTTFVLQSLSYEEAELDSYRKKAEVLVKGMNASKVDALFIQPEDTILGMESLRKLEKMAKFPFVSTNILEKEGDKPLFVPYLKYEEYNPPVLVLGLSGVSPYYPKSKEAMKVIAPEEAIKNTLKTLSEKEWFIIVVTPFDRETKLSLQQKFPQIRIWLGGPEGKSGAPRDQISNTALSLSALDMGREITRVDLKIAPINYSFYHPDFVNTLKKENREMSSENSVPFQFTTEGLGPRYDKPKNSNSKLIKAASILK